MYVVLTDTDYSTILIQSLNLYVVYRSILAQSTWLKYIATNHLQVDCLSCLLRLSVEDTVRCSTRWVCPLELHTLVHTVDNTLTSLTRYDCLKTLVDRYRLTQVIVSSLLCLYLLLPRYRNKLVTYRTIVYILSIDLTTTCCRINLKIHLYDILLTNLEHTLLNICQEPVVSHESTRLICYALLEIRHLSLTCYAQLSTLAIADYPPDR